MTALITEPGAYSDIDAADYHRNPNLLPGPSLSSSGAKLILNQSPFHFWHDSPLNPNRPAEDDKPHFSIGKAAHDMILLEGRWDDAYHVTPDGFNAGHHKKWADAVAELEAAQEAGKCILRHQDMEVVERVVAAIRRNVFAMKALTNGESEVTLAWKDAKRGVWLRARPDFLPHSFRAGGRVMILPDLKFMAATQCDPVGFGRAVANFGYHQSLAFYADGIKAVLDCKPTHFLLIPVEKDAPHCVSLYEIPVEDIERGRWLNRKAIDLFADCLEADRWPGYADEPRQVGLPAWERKRIDESGAWNEPTQWPDAA
ncbi:PD-(D/E)XK nuclease-like domain-containing protein [Sphingobium abikonense]|uniref:PD-(D/E)XK nuclease-like domain-containing protein n=1 Tax=Sphingobium abikonense TaxID=86193 RepID=UPI0035111D70